jgi:endonuclease III
MLNCTTRKQVEKILPNFFSCWPTPQQFLIADPAAVSNLISPLGFKNRRTQRLFEMTRAYVTNNWKHAMDLPGVGDYAARAWEIFFKNKLGDHPPDDGALVMYWNWRKKHGI